MENILNFLTIDKLVSIATFILKPLLIFIICKILIKFAIKFSNGIMEKTKLDTGIKGFAQTAIKIALWILVAIFIADSLGINTASLVALVSVVSLALSLAFQNIMTNVFSGVIILVSKPFVVGDYVEVAGISGTVKNISLMRTTIATPDNKLHFVPNGSIDASNITNYSTETTRRVDIKVSASYDASTEAVKKAIFEVLDKDNRIIREEDKTPFARLSAYNANDIEYTVRVWVNSADYWNVYFDTMENIRESFAKHNVEFSYPHMVIHTEQ